MIGVSITSLRRWDQSKFLSSSYRTEGGHRRYNLRTIQQWLHRHQERNPQNSNIKKNSSLTTRVVLYARVSASKQKNDLTRQEQTLKTYVEQYGWQILKIYRDIGSGLNDQRPGLRRLLRNLPVLQPTYIVYAYPDRLSRFGQNLLKTYVAFFNTELLSIYPEIEVESVEQRLVRDIVAILTSFAGKLHRQRRGRQSDKTLNFGQRSSVKVKV